MHAKRASHTVGLDIGTSRVTCLVGEFGRRRAGRHRRIGEA